MPPLSGRRQSHHAERRFGERPLAKLPRPFALRHRGMSLLIAVLTRLLGWLPLAAMRAIARAVGWLLLHSRSDMARITKINLSKSFPGLDERAVDRLAKQSLSHTACLFFESGALVRWPSHRLRQLIVAETGRDRLDAGLATGGVLLLVPHFGSWEFICFALGPLQFVALYEPPRLRSLETPLRRMRERFGARLHPINASGLRAAYRQLGQGGLVCLLPDQVPEVSGGLYAPFFGHQVLTATFAHRLIARTRPAVMLGSARRVPAGFSLAYEAVGEAWATSPQAFARGLNRAIEELVRRDPAQYQWEYKRFKRQPEGQPEFYPKR